MIEIRLRNAEGSDMGTVEADEVPPVDCVLVVGGQYFVRNQRNENQWREVPAVTLTASMATAEPVKVPGNLPPVTAPKKADDSD